MSDLDRGVVFWSVGNGDSTTLAINDETVVQIDLHHCGDDEDDEHVPVIDRLAELLPERDGKPYLAAFGATHLDTDHVRGFKRLLDEVTIGDLWFTPRILWDQDQSELGDDAKAFVAEAERRIAKTKRSSEVGSGDRVRIIGYMEAVREHYRDVPEEAITVPGNAFTSVDGVDLEGVFRAFVHAPFKDDGEKERNDTSFGMQVTLSAEEGDLRVLMLGDLAYATLNRIFARSTAADLEWDVLLAPHHCSKRVMYERNGDRNVLRRDILEAFDAAANEGAYIVASSQSIPASDSDGANPPHRAAANRYEEIVDDGHFLVTAEQAPDVIAFAAGETAQLVEGNAPAGESLLLSAIAAARGQTKPATTRVGFGRS